MTARAPRFGETAVACLVYLAFGMPAAPLAVLFVASAVGGILLVVAPRVRTTVASGT